MKRIVIDIREPYEYRMGHIEGAINITKDLLELVPEKYLNLYDYYILYCDMGIYSLKLSKELNMKGYKTISLEGGYTSYQNSKI